MIQIKFLENTNGLLKGFRISGHERTKRGQDALFCAAVSAVSRSFIRICQFEGLQTQVEARKRGEICFFLNQIPKTTESYRGIVSLFKQTLLDLRSENPDLIKLEIAKEDSGVLVRGGLK